MKRYPLYILVVASTLLSSCSRYLDQTPSTSIASEEAVNSLDALETAVNGVYSPLSSDSYGYAGVLALYADGRGGDIFAVSTGYNQTLSIHRLQTDRTSGFSNGTYSVLARILGRANDVLEKSEALRSSLSADSESQAFFRDQVAQLYALRALAHFELARIFSYLPTSGVNVDAPNSGIPLNVGVSPLGHAYQRSTLRQTYEQIISDFQQAREGLSRQKAVNSGKINYWAATALLSRAYLYNGDYQRAYQTAIEVIDQSPYRLYTRDEYPEVWSRQGTNESLFENLVTEQSNTGLNSIGNYTRPTGYPEFAAAANFVSWMQATRTGDIRQSLITEQSNQGANRGYYSLKYPGQVGAANPTAMNDYKVIRLSEVYLIAAEAQLKGATATNGHTALELYNALRQQRIAPFSAATAVTLDDLLDERRIELFCEGHRYYDLARNGRRIPTQYVANTTEVDPLDERLVSELPEREYNINRELVLKAAK